MVGPRKVVPQRLRGIGSQEYRSRMAHIGQQLERLCRQKLHMLRSGDIGKAQGLLHILCNNDKAVALDGCPGNFLSGHLLHLLLHLCRHLFCQSLIIGDYNTGGQRIMLCLTQHIRRRIHRVGSLVSHNEDFTGTCQHINIHMAIDFLLGQSHKDIARAGNLIHPRDSSRAKSHGRNGLGPANLVNLADPCQLSGNEHIGIDLAVLRGHHHNDFPHPSHRRGHSIHQHRGRVGRRASGHIDAHPVQGNQGLPKNGALLPVGHPGVGLLLLMVAAHIGGSLLQGFHHLGICRLFRCLELRLRHQEILRLKLHPVNQFGITDNRLITLAAHITYNTPYQLSSGQILAEKLLIALANLVAQLHLIEGLLLQKDLDSGLPQFLCLDYLHLASPSAAMTFFNSSTKV